MPARLVFLASLLVAALSVGAEGVQTQQGTPGAATPTVQASVRNAGPLPAGCEPEEVVAFLTAFFEAFNRGDMAALPGFFPEEGVYPYADQRGLQWYSVTYQDEHFVTYDPAELPAYFAARHKQREQLRLLELEVAAGWQDEVALVFSLRRQADDLPRHRAVGKGMMYCDVQTIFVWSMGKGVREPSPRATPGL